MHYILNYFIVFLILFFILYIFEYMLKKKKEDLGTIRSFHYIVKKYDLHMNKDRVKILSKLIVFINTFILSIPIYLVCILDIPYALLLVVAFVLFIVLFFILYNLIGLFLKKKGW